jgi:IclR family transcriptional regulator, KDG regulon repressor
MPRKADKTAPAPAYQVRVLDRAIDILECFTPGRRELGLPEIVRMTGLNRSTARRLAANLVRRGLLQEVAMTGRYRLGLRLFEMGSIVAGSFSLLEAAAGPVAHLEETLSGTILLAAPSEDHFVIIDRRECVRDGVAMVSMRSQIGTVRPLTYGPIGRVFLSARSGQDVLDLLRKYPLERATPYSITEDEFLDRLPAVLQAGYETDVNEIVEGIMGIAVRIVDSSGATAGVLCLGLPATREKDAAFLELALAKLKEASAAISVNLGYGGEPGTGA